MDDDDFHMTNPAGRLAALMIALQGVGPTVGERLARALVVGDEELPSQSEVFRRLGGAFALADQVHENMGRLGDIRPVVIEKQR